MNIIVFFSALVIFGLVSYLSPWIWRQFVMSKVARRVVGRRILALTFDDGPNPELTPTILDLLKSHNAKATFFVVGKNARKYPEIVDRIRSEGHDLGCHSDQHLNAWKIVPWRAVSDINAGYRALSPWLSSDAIFRPPHGKMTLVTWLAIRRRGAKVWWWTLDSGDTHEELPSPQAVQHEVTSKHGAIVLLHDLHTQSRPEQRDRFVLQMTAALLEQARRESLVVAPLGQV
jgi:peptidoglycan-N-acetylglucosamine deacetylase